MDVQTVSMDIAACMAEIKHTHPNNPENFTPTCSLTPFLH